MNRRAFVNCSYVHHWSKNQEDINKHNADVNKFEYS